MLFTLSALERSPRKKGRPIQKINGIQEQNNSFYKIIFVMNFYAVNKTYFIFFEKGNAIIKK